MRTIFGLVFFEAGHIEQHFWLGGQIHVLEAMRGSVLEERNNGLV